jgi:hypothetical protein
MRAVLLKSSSINDIDRKQLENKNWSNRKANDRSTMIISTNKVLFPDTVQSKAEEEEEKKIEDLSNAVLWCEVNHRAYSIDEDDLEITCGQCGSVIATGANFSQVDDLDTFQLPLICQDCENPRKSCKVYGCERVCMRRSLDYCKEHIYSPQASADVEAKIFLGILQRTAELPPWNFPN